MEKRFLSGNALKLIAAVSMVVDHIIFYPVHLVLLEGIYMLIR